MHSMKSKKLCMKVKRVNDSIIKTREMISKINNFSNNRINIMEVCGTHTTAIGKSGIRNMLGENINLISGPGCPVCVTPDVYIDYMYELSQIDDIIIATYGDMIRVPGSRPNLTLENAKANGADVRIVYSSIDAVKIANENKSKKVVFIGIGFETTAPHTAAALLESQRLNLNNFYVLSLHKKVEPVMRLLLEDKSVEIDGFLCPGHVAAIIGEKGFDFLNEYTCPGVVAGFEPFEITEAIYMLTNMISRGMGGVKNCYGRLVKREGNLSAVKLIDQVFQESDDIWRGMGKIKSSGLKLKKEFISNDIERLYPVDYTKADINKSCHCGEVLRGKIKPFECNMFAKVCTPENPMGPCMVSSEGSCAAYYKYK
jgi:hydrogenase expression/formation protein HypD